MIPEPSLLRQGKSPCATRLPCPWRALMIGIFNRMLREIWGLRVRCLTGTIPECGRQKVTRHRMLSASGTGKWIIGFWNELLL